MEFDDAVRLTAKRYLKFDHHSGTSVAHDLQGCLGGEPVFVPAAGATAEDDGYLLALVNDQTGAASALVVLDASRLDAPEIARVHIRPACHSGSTAAGFPTRRSPVRAEHRNRRALGA